MKGLPPKGAGKKMGKSAGAPSFPFQRPKQVGAPKEPKPTAMGQGPVAPFKAKSKAPAMGQGPMAPFKKGK